MSPIVIVGASHAAAQAIASLRQMGHDAPITLVSDEPHLPYHRPPLSKDYLSGSKGLDDILIRPASAYEDVELRLGERVEAIDRKARHVRLRGGDTICYSKLILCTGARVRRLPVPGAEANGVLYLRDQSDAAAIRDRVEALRARDDARAVVIGGGYIGLECAASLRKHGLEVCVLEAQARILQRVTAPEMSAFYARIHREEGVELREGETAAAIEVDGDRLAVVTGEGDRLPADLVVVGIGVIPNTELAEDAGLAVEGGAPGGIRVDAHGRTSDPDIYAAGDVAHHYSPIYDRHMRVESVPNATEMAKSVAAHIVHSARGEGEAAPAFGALPWFWSDQYDLKLQIAGLSEGYDDLVVRGDTQEGREVAMYYFDGPRLLAVDAVNRPRDFMFARMAIAKGLRLDKTSLADPDAELKSTVVTDM